MKNILLFWSLINYSSKQRSLDKQRYRERERERERERGKEGERERERERERQRDSNLHFWGKWFEVLKLIWFNDSGTPLGDICFQSISYDFDPLYITHRKTNLLKLAVIKAPDQCLTTYVFICPMFRFMLFYPHDFSTYVLNFPFNCPRLLVLICIIYGFLSTWSLTLIWVNFQGPKMFNALV